MLAGAAGLAAAAAPERVDVDGRAVRLRDLGGLAGFAAAARGPGADEAIATLPAGRDRIVVTRRTLEALARRAVPAVALGEGGPDGPVAIHRRVSAREGCVAAARPILAGEAIAPGDLVPADCAVGRARAPLHYRSGEGVVAAAPIAAGVPLGRLAPPPPHDVARGAELTLVSRAGPVTISRPVTALQPGRGGRRLFVRDADGAVFAIRLDAQEAKEEGQ
jgi:hypothetical protein